MDRSDVQRLRDRLLTSDRGSTNVDWARGVAAMSSAVIGALLTAPEDVDALRHPHQGLRVRLKTRPVDLVVDKVVVSADHGTSVFCHQLLHDGAPARWVARRYRMKLKTWRRWVKGARVMSTSTAPVEGS